MELEWCLYILLFNMSNIYLDKNYSFFFFERQIWITDGPLEYHRATSGTTRSYPSPLDIMPIHQFKRKPNRYGKNPRCGNRTQDLLVPKPYPTPRCH
ncbi:hypothetical protein Hanom_Chr16g01476151 [Helianthus anomalus]